MVDFWLEHQAGLVYFLLALHVIALSNWWVLRPLQAYPVAKQYPFLSVLVPARNEAANIEPCLRSLLAQDYPNYQVCALDDRSTDDTGARLARLAQEDSRLQVFSGLELPAGWIGKHWACQQLAQAAQGELLLFVDADTRFQPQALRTAANALEAENAGLLTALPYEQTLSWGEKLTVPLLPWCIFVFWPLALARLLRWPALALGIGQFMLFRRSAYQQIGGHAAVRSQPVDDLALARRITAQGLRVRLVDGSRYISCRMYTSFSAAHAGFSKNLYAAFGYNPGLFAFIWAWLGIVFLEPLLVLVLWLAGVGLPAASPALAGSAAGLALLLWGLFCRRFGYPLYQALLYPFVSLVILSLALRSAWLTLTGQARWKERLLPQPAKRRPAPEKTDQSGKNARPTS